MYIKLTKSKFGKVLVACEESQALTIELRKLGIRAYSCDIQECSGLHPEWHIQCDVRDLLKYKWNTIIAFPPCTHLACSGARHFRKKIKNGQQRAGINFFMIFANSSCPRTSIENPVGIMSKYYRKPDQIINPWQFGESINKRTCLWLKGLPKLKPTKIVQKDEVIVFPSGKTMSKWFVETSMLKKEDRSKARSKTFMGVAKAMAHQWAEYIKEEKIYIPRGKRFLYE